MPTTRAVRSEQRLSCVDQLSRRVDEVDTPSEARRLDRVARAGERAGVRARGAAARGGAADREQHDRLPGRPRRLDKGAAISEVLAVDADHARRLVLGERGDELGDADVRLVADRDRPREAEAVVLEQESDLEQDVAALREEPDRPGRQRCRRELELARAVEDAEAVRPHEHRSRCAHPLNERPLVRGSLPPELGEARSDRYERPRAGRQRVVDRLLEPVRWHAEDDELGRLRQLFERAMDAHPVHLAAVPADEIDAPAVRAPGRVPREPVAPLGGIGGDADDGESLRLEERPQIAGHRAPIERPARSGRGSSACRRVSSATRSHTGSADGAACPLSVSTWRSICSAVASGSASPSRRRTWKMWRRFSSESSTWVVTYTRSPAASCRRWERCVSTLK